MLPVRPTTPDTPPPRRGGRLFVLWLVGVLVIIGAETGRRRVRSGHEDHGQQAGKPFH